MLRPAGLREEVALAEHTTLRIGGPAQFFLSVSTRAELQSALSWATEKGIPVAVLGGGANVVIADAGFPGLMVLMANETLVWGPNTVQVGAGTKLGFLIAQSLRRGFGGLGWLIGVPGTVGGSIFGNAGSRDHALGDYVISVTAVQPDGQTKKWEARDCHFRYRASRFKDEHQIIWEAELKLPAVDPVAERKVLVKAAEKKQSSQPLSDLTAGCMFTNPKVERAQLPMSLQNFLEPDSTISAWRLVDMVGLKGKTIGGISVSTQHANFMINTGQGTAGEAVQLISFIKQRVRDTLGIQLQEEIQFLGFLPHAHHH
ncbi:MAG: UDP-N-acetylmuramate dehydrogenase [Candidatus Kerfeldbacteria bacterium]|nr:UDP-N-acetylmuramate dehydrogenase [Candidatus Kerfeldbacteria bacterium]